MTEVNGPYIIEDVGYLRNPKDRNNGTLMLIAAGGEKFGAPMSTDQLKALIEKLQCELDL